MNTQWMLLGRYAGMPVLPVETVIKDFFPTMNRETFLRKVADGSIALPLVRMEQSQKGAKGVYLTDLAAYIDKRRAEALEDYHQFHGLAA